MANDNENESTLYSTVSYTGDGTTTSFTVPFPYLYVDDVHIYLDGSEVDVYPVISTSDPPSPYTAHWYTSNTIRFLEAPSDGAVVRINRVTNKENPEVQFSNSSILNEEDLNIIATQLLYVVQEAYDAFGGDYSAIATLITEVGNAKDAAVAAKNDAVSAKDDAVSAKNSAVSAKNDAVSAKNDAVSAKETAVSAKEDAVSAKNTASSAKDDAVSAKDDAVSAKNDAVSAKNTAVSAKDDAVSAKNSAVSAKTSAETAQGIAESAAEVAIRNGSYQSGSEVFYDIPYKNTGVGKWGIGVQGFAVNGSNLYILEYTETNGSANPGILHRYTLNGTSVPTYVSSSGSSTYFGHQSLGVDDTGKLISQSYASKQKLFRASYSTGNIQPASPGYVTLFESGFTASYSSTPAISPDKKLLAATGIETSTSQRKLRIWNYADTKTYADVSAKYKHQFRMQETENKTIQALAIANDGTIFVICGGNSLSKNKYFYVYSKTGTLLYKDEAFGAGIGFALKDGGVFEPEGLNFVYDGSAYRLMCLMICGASTGNRHAFICELGSAGQGAIELNSPTDSKSVYIVNDDGTVRIYRNGNCQTSIIPNGYTTLTAHRGNFNLNLGASSSTFYLKDSSGDSAVNLALIDTSSVRFGKTTRPISNNAVSLGASSYRWTTVYATSGSIDTSDERMKDNIDDVDEALMRAWGKVNFKVFQFKDAIEKKGEDYARLHVGIIAQQVAEAFESEGLDASRYGLFCYDEWDAKEAIIDPETGEIAEEALPAGSMYSIRYEEALALECAYQRWRLDQLEARFSND